MRIRQALLGSYLGPELVSEGRRLILFGKTGRGKTHLAIAVAYKAIQNGFSAKFVTAAELIADLSDAAREGGFREALSTYTQPQVLVVDEVGYLAYSDDAANVLFHVANDRHLAHKPMIFTTNKSPLTNWGGVLHDHDLAEAIVDRILERGRLLVLVLRCTPRGLARCTLDGTTGVTPATRRPAGPHRPPARDYPTRRFVRTPCSTSTRSMYASI